MINKSKLILISAAILIFTAVSAIAQTNRAYVADSGSDANLCTRAAQCKTITKALTVVDKGGEVIITQSGNYDNFTVTKSVTVAAEPGVDAQIATTKATAVFINGAEPIESVTIRNLNLKHIASDFYPQGISNYNAANLYVDSCTIVGFAVGIADSSAGKLFVHNGVFRSNSVGIQNYLEVGMLTAVIEDSQFENNIMGLWIDAQAFTTIRNCVISENSEFGIYLLSHKSGASAEAVIDNCQLTGNKVGLLVQNNSGPASAKLSNSTVTQNLTTGIAVQGGAILYSFRNNVIAGNATDVSGVLTYNSLK